MIILVNYTPDLCRYPVLAGFLSGMFGLVGAIQQCDQAGYPIAQLSYADAHRHAQFAAFGGHSVLFDIYAQPFHGARR